MSTAPSRSRCSIERADVARVLGDAVTALDRRRRAVAAEVQRHDAVPGCERVDVAPEEVPRHADAVQEHERRAGAGVGDRDGRPGGKLDQVLGHPRTIPHREPRRPDEAGRHRSSARCRVRDRPARRSPRSRWELLPGEHRRAVGRGDRERQPPRAPRRARRRPPDDRGRGACDRRRRRVHGARLGHAPHLPSGPGRRRLRAGPRGARAGVRVVAGGAGAHQRPARGAGAGHPRPRRRPRDPRRAGRRRLPRQRAQGLLHRQLRTEVDGRVGRHAEDDPDGQRTGPFLVPADAAGITIVETWDHLGMRASASHDVVFDDTPIPASTPPASCRRARSTTGCAAPTCWAG